MKITVFKNTKQIEQTRTFKKLEVESGAIEELASSAYRSHPPCNLCRNRENVKVMNYGLAINMENVSQHVTK